MAETDFYFKKNPPSKPITVRSSVVIRLPLFQHGEVGPETNEYPSFQTLYQNYTAEDFARLLTDGALNKAIKYALLYNYFGFPVANIKDSEGQDNYRKGSLQFESQNNYHLKYTDFLISTEATQAIKGNKEGEIPPSLSTKEFYQYGLFTAMPDFAVFNPYNYFDDPDTKASRSFENIQNELNSESGAETNFVKDIYMCLHGSDNGDYPSQYVGGFNSFVEPIGVSAKGSLFYAGNTTSHLSLIQFNIWSPSSDGVGLNLENVSGELGTTLGEMDFLSRLKEWQSPYNPVDKTYARAWMPTSPISYYSSYTNELSNISLFEIEEVELNGFGSPDFDVGVSNIQHINVDNQFDDEIVDGTWTKPINSPYGGEAFDSLALFVGPYQTSDWYQPYPGYGTNQSSEEDYVTEFSKYNIASMYKLAPIIPGLQDTSVGGGFLNNYLEDPARTLNSIYPKIFKYVTDIVPTDPVFSGNHKNTAGNVTVVDPDKVKGIKLTLSDVQRKFRLSADDYSTKQYYNTPSITSLGFTHTIGDNSISGKELTEPIGGAILSMDPQSLEARNKFFVATKTESQRAYLLQEKHFELGLNSMLEDPNFSVSVFPSPLANNLLGDIRAVFIGDTNQYNPQGYDLGQELDELQKTYKFSEYLLSSLYLKAPPYYSSVQSDEESQSLIKHKPYPINLDLGINIDAADAGDDLAAYFLKLLSEKIHDTGTGEEGWNTSYALPFAKWLFTSGASKETILKSLKSMLFSSGYTVTDGGGLSPDEDEEVLGVDDFLAGEGFGGPPGPEGSIVSDSGMSVKTDSPLAFPVWIYKSQDINKIDWSSLGDFSTEGSLNESLANVFGSNPSAQYIKDYGVPEWVRGLRIYPTLDNDTTVTRPDNSSLSNTKNSDFLVTAEDIDDILSTNAFNAENNTFLTGYKNYSNNQTAGVNIVKKMIPAVTIVMEPWITGNGVGGQQVDFNATDDNSIFNPPESKAYVDIRYAVEIDIDEKDLMLDMMGQGVFSFAGELSDYEKLGFDIQKLLFKSNGNLASESLIDAYDDSDYTFEGVYGYDFGSFADLAGADADSCPTFPPDVVNQKASSILSNSSDPYACTSYVCLEGTGKVSEQLKAAPGKDADNIGYLKSNTVVKVLKEWVNGKGEYNKIKVADETSTLNGSQGFVHPGVLRPLFPNLATSKKIFFNQIFDNQDPNKKYTLAETKVTTMGEFADMIKPDWWKDDKMRYGQPYEYIQEGEYWYTVELDYNCIIDEADLEAKIYEAKIKGIKELLNFYGKSYTNGDVEKLINTYLAVRVDVDLGGSENGDSSRNGFHVSDRPGDPILFLVKAGGIYINAFPDKQESLSELKDKSTKIISLNTRWFQTHIQQSIFALNSLYYDILSSDFRVLNFNFKKETERMSFVPPYLKRILYANGYEIDSQQDNIINVGFNSQYGVTFFSYKEKDKEEKLLKVGYEYFASQEPFVFKNTMALLYRHRQIKDPTLKSDWQKVFKQWLPDPKPMIVPKGDGDGYPSDSKCTPNLTWNPPPLSQIWEQVAANLDEALDLDPRYDLGSFRFNMMEYFPPCPKPPSGRGLTVMRLLSEIEGETKIFDDLDILDSVAQEVDRIGQYVGDFMSSAQALEDLKLKIFTMDDLYSFLLNYISPELLYSKICKCFIDLLDIPDISVPNLEINATGGSGGLNLNPSQIGKDPKELYDVQGPEGDSNLFEEKEVISSEDLFCSFCFRVPSVFLRLPSTDILAELINVFKKLLEFALAQILLQLIASLLDLLLTCPDLECAPGASRVKDYGNQNLANTFNNSSPNLSDFMSDCGLLIDGENITEPEVITMLQEISDKLTTSEVLGLLSGSPTKETIKVVQRVVAHYPSINNVFSDIGIIENFFMCAGDKIDLDQIEDANLQNVSDPMVCLNFNEISSDNILDKCGSLGEKLFDAIKDRNLNHNMEKYKKIASFIRNNDDLSNQMPSLFEDGKGTQALLSAMNVGTADQMVDQTIDTISIPIATSLSRESSGLTDPRHKKLVKQNDRMKALYTMPIGSFIWSGLGSSDGSDDLTGHSELVWNEEDSEFKEVAVAGIDTILADLNNSLQFHKESYTIGLSVPDSDTASCSIKFNPPKKDPQTQEYIYSNNFKVDIFSDLPFYSTPIEYSIVGTENQIPEDVRQYIQKFELENTEIPEQAQVFGNVIVSEINNLLEKSSISDSDISAQVNELRDIFQQDLYLNSVGTIVNNIAEVISNGNILKEYKTDRSEELLSFPVVAQMAALYLTNPLIGTAMTAAVAANTYPSYTKKQLQHVNFASSFASGDSSGIIDFELVKQIVKDNYNFAKDTDQNSEAIGMPQMAILNGLISAFVQLFAGEAYAKGAFTLAHYPKELFDENLNGGILSHYVAELIIRFLSENDLGYTSEGEQWGNFSFAWSSTVARILAEKPEFTNLHPTEALPGLPGESVEKGDNITNATGISGKMYDVVTGKEENIQNWQDATRYFARQNMQSPLNFIKKRLNSVNYKDLARDEENNPFDSLVFDQVLEVHSKIVSDLSLTQLSDLNEDGTLTEEDMETVISSILPEMQEGEIANYFDQISESSLFSAGSANADPTVFANGRFFYQYYFRIEDWESESEAQLNEGIYIENLVNRQIMKSWGIQKSNSDLYGVLNRANFLQILKNMYPAGFNYDLSDDQTKEPINKFFKSIKFGIRFCYGSIQSTELEIENQTKETKELNDLLNSTITKIHQNDKGKEFCKNEKILKIVELDVQKDTGTAPSAMKQDKRISYVIPVKSKEVSIKSSDLFKLSCAEFNEEENDYQIINWEDERKGLFNSVFSDLNGFSEGSENTEFKTLFMYCIPLPVLVNIFLIYNVAILSTGKGVNNAFHDTKSIIKDTFNSTYNIRGPLYWKDTPEYISSRGGPLGMAVSSTQNKK